MKIRLNTIEDVNEFVAVCSKYHGCDIDVTQNKYIVNGKSVLGIFSLNLLEPVKVIISQEYDDLKIAFYKEIARWKSETN